MLVSEVIFKNLYLDNSVNMSSESITLERLVSLFFSFCIFFKLKLDSQEMIKQKVTEFTEIDAVR